MQNNYLVVGASDLSYGTFQCKKFQLPMIDNKSSTIVCFYKCVAGYEKKISAK